MFKSANIASMISDQYLPKAVSFQIVNVFFEIHV